MYSCTHTYSVLLSSPWVPFTLIGPKHGRGQDPARDPQQWQSQRKPVPKHRLLSLTTEQSLSLLITYRQQRPHWLTQATKPPQTTQYTALGLFPQEGNTPKWKAIGPWILQFQAQIQPLSPTVFLAFLELFLKQVSRAKVTVLTHNTICTKIHKRAALEPAPSSCALTCLSRTEVFLHSKVLNVTV